ncbi:pilus assembly protein CpaE [Cellulomonas edaphi]|uniref:Pilus assembly protein CpaE n=1 Tax=Cellulomonas edaphi TaxID=3053468 RepID=A0ABT7S9V0_9CELL|nr:pilus assembly protein CpaE [Cellulomons edaphi]MDM7832398.1 pilus assembly protein CpaE [Cellulomons edaphi]
MISTDLALLLRSAGLRWTPASGDRFRVLVDGLDDDVFTISEMTIEAHAYDTGTVLGFNGTTEWALDSVAQEDALWLPREDQLREKLGGTFRSLARSLDGSFQVVIEVAGRPAQAFGSDTAEDAYALALLSLVTAAVDEAVRAPH